MRRTTIDKEIIGEREELKRSKKKRKKGRKLKKFLIFIFMLGTIGCYTGLFLLYGPYAGFRDWLITTAMTTMNHQYFATWFYDNETINDCLNRNKIVEVADSTNTDMIEIVDYSKDNQITYENEYERQILEKSSNNNDYKIIEIEGSKYTGYLVAIYDP